MMTRLKMARKTTRKPLRHHKPKLPPSPPRHYWELLVPVEGSREVWLRTACQLLSPDRISYPLDDRWQRVDGTVVTPVRITSTAAERRELVSMTAAYYNLDSVTHYTLCPDAKVTKFRKRDGE